MCVCVCARVHVRVRVDACSHTHMCEHVYMLLCACLCVSVFVPFGIFCWKSCRYNWNVELMNLWLKRIFNISSFANDMALTHQI